MLRKKNGQENEVRDPSELRYMILKEGIEGSAQSLIKSEDVVEYLKAKILLEKGTYTNPLSAIMNYAVIEYYPNSEGVRHSAEWWLFNAMTNWPVTEIARSLAWKI